MPIPDLPVSEMTGVAAVVVTYHPDAAVLANLIALCAEVEHVIVVDNGSTVEKVAQLQRGAAQLGFDLVLNGENLGIAAALNIGARQALAAGARWLFLFDQDSTIVTGFVATMLSTWQQLAASATPGLLVPRYQDRATHQLMPVQRLPDGSLATAITSGTLLSTAVWQELGPLIDELFIDSVDHEYCLRARRAGKAIRCCEGATILHSLGEARQHSFLHVFRFASTNHSPLRRYYQERNKIWIYRHYLRRFPAYCRREMIRSAIDLGKLLLVEDDRASKARFFFRGLRDGLAGRMGAYRARE